MSRRNQRAYIDGAERCIDKAWQRLSVFKRDRSTALLSLVTITDDYLRWKFLSQPSDTSLMTLRVAQEALEFAVPWVYATCVNDNRPVPRTITEEQCLEGKALMEYAEAYNYAVMAFTNYHAGLYTAKAARRTSPYRFRLRIRRRIAGRNRQEGIRDDTRIRPPIRDHHH